MHFDILKKCLDKVTGNSKNLNFNGNILLKTITQILGPCMAFVHMTEQMKIFPKNEVLLMF